MYIGIEIVIVLFVKIIVYFLHGDFKEEVEEIEASLPAVRLGRAPQTVTLKVFV